MSPLDVIALPGHPGMFARRVAVEAWVSAGSPPVNSAGRLYAEQKRLYDGWREHKPGFNPADNPDDESEALAHVRFVAFDIDPTAERIKALAKAGLHRPYSYEPWHWELPNVHSYALVRAIPATASLDVTPITEQEEEHLMSQIQYYERTGTPQQEWMIAGEELPGGYEVTLDGNLARIWGRQYSGEGTIPVHVDRDTYIAAQAYWKDRAAKWEARQVARIKAALGTPTAGTTTTVNAAPIDYAKLAVVVAKAVNDDTAKRLAV